MIINSRIQRVSEERTPNQIYEATIVKTFGKPLDLIRAEVKALEEYELAQPPEVTDNWE